MDGNLGMGVGMYEQPCYLIISHRLRHGTLSVLPGKFMGESWNETGYGFHSCVKEAKSRYILLAAEIKLVTPEMAWTWFSTTYVH